MLRVCLQRLLFRGGDIRLDLDSGGDTPSSSLVWLLDFGRRAPVPTWRASRGSHPILATWRPQRGRLLLTTKVTSHHLCCSLWVTSKSRASPTCMGRAFHEGVSRRRGRLGPSRSLSLTPKCGLPEQSLGVRLLCGSEMCSSGEKQLLVGKRKAPRREPRLRSGGTPESDASVWPFTARVPSVPNQSCGELSSSLPPASLLAGHSEYVLRAE